MRRPPDKAWTAWVHSASPAAATQLLGMLVITLLHSTRHVQGEFRQSHHMPEYTPDHELVQDHQVITARIACPRRITHSCAIRQRTGMTDACGHVL